MNFTQEPSSYLSNPREKDYYGPVYKILVENSIQNVLDIGTASGDFLYFMPTEISGTGLDSSGELIRFATASRSRDNLKFIETTFEDFRPCEIYDAVTICGTLPTMEDWKLTLSSIIKLNPRIIIIHDAFNPFDVDIKLGYKYSHSLDEEFNFAYNVISISSMRNFLESESIAHKFSEFDMVTILERDPGNPLHNYHINCDGKKVLTNGTGLLLHTYTLEIYLN